MASLQAALYIHIPYCSYVCHYCDFAKTANFAALHVERYFAALADELERWQRALPKALRWQSVFFGGGTPSLFTKEYEPLFAIFAPRLNEGCEVSLEANPESVDVARLAYWHELGFNRISLGVQSFDEVGLRTLTRQHDRNKALQAVRAARRFFDKVNVDLIFGWPGQTLESLQQDLRVIGDEDIGHVSLYLLTLEGQTPFNLAAQRGRWREVAEEHVVQLYDLARNNLAAMGFLHEEVSNWAKPGQTCEHNWSYWLGRPYVGVGAGAHGYVPTSWRTATADLGVRYAYPRSDRVFAKQVEPKAALTQWRYEGESFAVEIDEGRDADAWLLEQVASALRTNRGVDLGHVRRTIGRELRRDADLGAMQATSDRLRLPPSEWLREGLWVRRAVELFNAMQTD